VTSLNKILAYHLPGMILLCIALMPDITFLHGLRVEDLLVIFGSIVLFSYRKKYGNVEFDYLHVGRNLFIIAIAGLLGMSIGVLYENVRAVINDFIILPQILKYYLIYLVISNTLPAEKTVEYFSRYINVAIILVSIIAIAQYWNVGNVNAWLTPLYLTKSDYYAKLALEQMVEAEQNFRVAGTMGNSNYFGYLIIWLLIWFLIYNIIRHPRKNKIINIVTFSMIGVALILIQSRTAILSISSVFIVLLFKIKGGEKKLSIIIPILMIVGSVLVIMNNDYLKERGLGERLNINSESTKTSYNARQRDLIVPILHVLDNPLLIPFGQGLSKAEIRSDSHNGFTWMLQRFGVIGMGAYILMIYITIKSANLIFKNSTFMWVEKYIAISSILCCIPWILGDLGGNIFKELRLTSLNMIMMGWIQYIQINKNYYHSEDYLLIKSKSKQ
jgi:hypothetical protein